MGGGRGRRGKLGAPACLWLRRVAKRLMWFASNCSPWICCNKKWNKTIRKKVNTNPIALLYYSTLPGWTGRLGKCDWVLGSLYTRWKRKWTGKAMVSVCKWLRWSEVLELIEVVRWSVRERQEVSGLRLARHWPSARLSTAVEVAALGACRTSSRHHFPVRKTRSCRRNWKPWGKETHQSRQFRARKYSKKRFVIL